VNDFASAAMMRVLAEGMRQQGLDPGGQVADAAGARVQLLRKQVLVRSAVEQGGLACLPLLGRGLHRLTHEPTHQALASARDADDLLGRWQRLERYVHSRHRCVVEACGPASARVRHLSLDRDTAPSPAEDLVVAGVLAALLEAIGLTAVSLRIGQAPAWPVPDARRLADSVARGATATWHFHWEVPPLRTVRTPASAPQEVGADPAWSPTVRAAYARLAADLTGSPGLPGLAAALGLAARTLQRRLQDHGLGYTRLLAEARCRVAAWRLLHTADPIAEVGFLCGFADQPHFTREMQRRVGLPPAAYRQAFGGSAA
jgi:AraC-like DNA-binding protein